MYFAILGSNCYYFKEILAGVQQYFNRKIFKVLYFRFPESFYAEHTQKILLFQFLKIPHA